jgi:RimJ/RimL family protein N-acetyltransferase
MSGCMKPTLTLSRLRLRPVASTDATDLLALDADPEVRRYLHMPSAPTLAQVEATIARWQASDRDTPLVGYWMAEEVTTGQFLGWFHLRPPREGSPLNADDQELGYRLRRDCWGRGYATEGSRLLIEYGFERLKASRIAATALAENAASIRVMQKVGMVWVKDWKLYGELDAVMYALQRRFKN